MRLPSDTMSGPVNLESMISACAGGDPRASADLLAFYQALDLRDPRRDQILDGLAQEARRSRSALDVVIEIIYHERFVRSEIRKVLINDDAAAEEALQETALAMINGLATFRGESSFRTWISTIGRNQAIAILRRRKPTVPFDEDGRADATNPRDAQLPELARYSSLLADRADLDAALAMLSDELREAVRLRDIERRSYQEIADILGIKLNTVRSRLARGRAQLAVTLGPQP